MGTTDNFRAIWVCGIFLGFALVPSSLFGAGAVTLDGSFGTSGALAGPNFQITAAMGQQIGPNLFHSFSTFNLVNGESATFSGPANIQNILARVTGGNASSIDGTINSSIVGANLFLLNPSGVMFGPNAQVNVTGSFVTGTPDVVKLADGGIFLTSLGGADNLTSAPVSAFGFLSATPAPVSFDGSAFTSGMGTGIHVIGGDVLLDNGATLFKPTGTVSIFSAASAGEVPFSLASPGDGFASATNPRFGTITIQNGAAAAIAGSGGGKVVIRGGRLTVDQGFVTTVNNGAGPGPDASIQVNHLVVQNNGLIRSVAIGTGPGGHVDIAADDIAVVGGGGETGIVNSTAAGGQGGDLTITVTGGLTLTQGGVIGQSTSGTGAGGNVTINAASVSLADSFIDLAAADSASAGALTMNVSGALTITGFGFIDATAFAAGNAGDIFIHAGSLLIDGTGEAPAGNLGIFAESQGSGNAGNVTLNIDGAAVVMMGGQIDSSAFFGGNGGNIAIHAGSLAVSGSSDPAYATLIGSTSRSSSTGNAGTVTIDVTGAMSVTSGAEISGTTFSSGQGGGPVNPRRDPAFGWEPDAGYAHRHRLHNEFPAPDGGQRRIGDGDCGRRANRRRARRNRERHIFIQPERRCHAQRGRPVDPRRFQARESFRDFRADWKYGAGGIGIRQRCRRDRHRGAGRNRYLDVLVRTGGRCHRARAIAFSRWHRRTRGLERRRFDRDGDLLRPGGFG